MTEHASLSTRTEHIGTLYVVALLREELGRRIASARHEADLTQQQLAERIGLKHAQDVSRYERGVISVPDFRIDRIAEATGRPRSFFVRDPAEPEPPPAERWEQMEQEIAALRRDLQQVVGLLETIAPPAERAPRARPAARRSAAGL